MNVLSLFDGISCGQVALKKSNIAVKQYFASEVDKYAINITRHNYPNTIQLGNVTKLKTSNIPKIDLLIGGSPCQGFSYAGKRLNFEDSRSNLFFEFVRLLKECNPKYFLLENVLMCQKSKNIITKYIGVSPIEINSSLLSKQNRKRLYWTNIPNIKQPKDKKLLYNKYLYRLSHGYIRSGIKLYKKYPSLTAQYPSTKYRIVVNMDLLKQSTNKEIRNNSNITRCATPEECEELQTLPRGYTSTILKTQRYKAIGNGWTIDIISHIFNNLK